MVAAAAVVAFAARILWSNLRIALVRKASITISPDHLLLRHEGIFKAPVTIQREGVRVVSFDDRPARRRGRDHPRFALPDAGENEPEWLYSRTTGSPFPLISQVPDVPNMAIVLHQPVELPKPRRFVKAFPSKQIFVPPLKGRPSRGLLLRLKDPAGARNELEEHYEVRDLVGTDLPEPDLRSRERARRLTLRDNVVMGSLIVVQFALPIALADDSAPPPGSETFSALGQICGVEEVDAREFEPASESLGDLLILKRGEMSLMFDSLIDVGDAALFARGDVGRWTQELLDHRYQRGYARRWNGPGLVLFGTVWEFPSADQAASFEIFARNASCNYVQDAFLVPGVAGAVGYTLQTPDRTIDQIAFVRGRFRFLIGAETTSPDYEHRAAIELAADIDRRL